MKFLGYLLIGLPAAIVLIALSVANTHDATVSLDPTTNVGATVAPALAFTIPMWMLLFGILVSGVVIGGIAAWASQHRYRREARTKRHEANHWHRQADEEHERAEQLARKEVMRSEPANDDAPAQIRRRPLPALSAPGR